MYKKLPANRVTVPSHFVESFEGLLQRCRWWGRGCKELWKNTIFPEHPVYKCFFVIIINCGRIIVVECMWGSGRRRGRLKFFEFYFFFCSKKRFWCCLSDAVISCLSSDRCSGLLFISWRVVAVHVISWLDPDNKTGAAR